LPAKKIAAQISYQVCLPRKSPNLCSLHSQLAKAAKKQTSKKHMVFYDIDPKCISVTLNNSKTVF
jgi:hypothetical protein